MPRDFSQDGAQGAYGGGGASTPTAPTMNDPGPVTSAPQTPSSSPMATATSNSQLVQDEASARKQSLGIPANGPSTPTITDPTELSILEGHVAGASAPMSGDLMFDSGGAIPDGGDSGDDSDQQGQQPAETSNGLIAQALAAVKDTLQYTRNQYGIGTTDEGTGQQAGMMPTIPGNQSETPGPYVPQQPKPQQTAGMMPTIPGNQSETPGPYVPQPPRPQQVGAIPDDDAQEAA